MLKRIINIIQADINSFLNRAEQRQANRAHNAGRKSHEWKGGGNTHGYGNTDDRKNAQRERDVGNSRLEQYYTNLEVPYDSDLDTVKRSWKRLLKKCHPDLYANDPSKHETAHDLTSKLNEAYREIEKSSNK